MKFMERFLSISEKERLAASVSVLAVAAALAASSVSAADLSGGVTATLAGFNHTDTLEILTKLGGVRSNNSIESTIVGISDPTHEKNGALLYDAYNGMGVAVAAPYWAVFQPFRPEAQTYAASVKATVGNQGGDPKSFVTILAEAPTATGSYAAHDNMAWIPESLTEGHLFRGQTQDGKLENNLKEVWSTSADPALFPGTDHFRYNLLPARSAEHQPARLDDGVLSDRLRALIQEASVKAAVGCQGGDPKSACLLSAASSLGDLNMVTTMVAYNGTDALSADYSDFNLQMPSGS